MCAIEQLARHSVTIEVAHARGNVRELRFVEGRIDDPIEKQLRVDTACFANAFDERRIHGKRRRAEIEKRFVVDRFRIGREHAGAGPRRRTARFAGIEDAHGRAALREFEGDG